MADTRHALAQEFISILTDWLTVDQMSELRSLTSKLEDNSICHTHDYCDANEAMWLAFKKVVGRECWMPSDVDFDKCLEIDMDSDFDLWDSAWKLAKEDGFYITEVGVDFIE